MPYTGVARLLSQAFSITQKVSLAGLPCHGESDLAMLMSGLVITNKDNRKLVHILANGVGSALDFVHALAIDFVWTLEIDSGNAHRTRKRRGLT